MEHLEHHVGRYEDQHLLHGAPLLPSPGSEAWAFRGLPGAVVELREPVTQFLQIGLAPLDFPDQGCKRKSPPGALSQQIELPIFYQKPSLTDHAATNAMAARRSDALVQRGSRNYRHEWQRRYKQSQ
jgi:hypothetical protein